ncbi:erythromycin esterase family protein, partial [Streptomyces sp. NPDC016640]
MTRRLAAALLLWLAVAPATASASPAGGGPGGPGGTVTSAEDVLPALEEAARPLRTTEASGPLEDLRPFGEAVGDAVVVGVGEAAHG